MNAMIRKLRGLSLAALSLSMLSVGLAQAQGRYPDGTISFVCASPPGSDSDTIVRYFADKVAKMSGATVIVENKAGAGGNIAAEYIARSKPDGQTVYIHAGSSTAANMHLFKNPPIDVTKDIRAIATIHRQGFMLTVAADSPYKTLQELTAAMKQKGDKASYGYGNTSAHVMGELYRSRTGVTAVPVPYSVSNQTLNDMKSGVIDYAIHNPILALGQARQGRLRILAIGTSERSKAAPDVPTMAEAGVPGVDLPSWFGVFVPGATPEPIVAQLSAWFKDVLSSEETVKFITNLGGDVFISTPEQADQLLEQNVKEWEDYVRLAQIPKQ